MKLSKNIPYSIPFSIEAEQAILAGIIIDNENWEKISENIEESDFYKKKHRIIFKILENEIKNNKSIDLLSLTEILKNNNNIIIIGGKEYLNEIITNTANTKNITTYVKIIKEYSALRKLIITSKNIIETSLNVKNKNIQDIIDKAEKEILSISKKHRKTENITTISQALTTTIKKIETFFESGSNITGLSSGFKELDNITSGLHKSDLIIIAGRPSMGKTTLAINIAENIIIKNNIPVLIFSMEMPAEQIATRMLSSLGRIELQRLRTGLLKETDWPRLSSAIAIMSGKNLYIDDSGSLTPYDINTKARKIYNLNKELGAIIIDYLQLMHIPDMNDFRASEISEISRSLKVLAKELNVPIIALSQLNRSLEQRTDKRPIMSDLRESGSIEQDADLIIFIYRDEIYNKNIKNKGIAEIIIAKQRNGPIGTINLKFFGHYSKFENLIDE
ncbi:MAG TPA: replicative DNA helicase [Candidatus Azoamicus sp.]